MSAAVTDEPEELFGQGLLSSFWKNEKLNDFALKGNDGIEVAANRYILSAKSKVFQNMLLGRFKEASSPVVEVGFPGQVLEQLVEYAYKDEVQGLTPLKGKAANDDSPQVDKDLIQRWSQLLEASVYFDLPRLKNKVTKCISKLMQECRPKVAFTIFELVRGGGVSPDLAKLALTRIQTFNNSSKIEASDVGFLSPSVLEEILMDRELNMTEFELFQMLQLWVNAGESLQPPDREDRKSLAMKMTGLVKLDKIHPKHLVKIVRPSGLVSEGKLLDVYEKSMQQSSIDPGIPRCLDYQLPSNHPSPIIVVGAGQPEVNGVYRHDGHFGGALKYSMEGKYEGDETTFAIYKAGFGGWFLSDDKTDLYCAKLRISGEVSEEVWAPSSISDLFVPPGTGWEKVGDGPLPPPRIVFLRQGGQAS